MSAPPDVLRFPCPACSAVLTVPVTVAGMQGPCPKCWEEIVSPDPARGTKAHLPEPVKLTMPVAPAPPIVIPPTQAEALPPLDELVSPPEVPPLPRREKQPTSTASRSRTGLFVTGGIALVALLGGGFYLGKQLKPSAPAPRLLIDPSLPPAPPSAAVPAEASAPAETPPPVMPPVPTGNPATDAEAVLIAFLSAPDWKARSAFILHPETDRASMEEHAAGQGDGPIEVISITLLEEALPNVFFKLCTPEIPEGFPVPVTLTDEGPRVDWEGFVGFHDDLFRKLNSGPAGQTGILDVFVKPEPEDSANPHFASYRLSVPMPGREASAWVRRDTVAFARLKAIFDGSDIIEPAAITSLLANEGVPLRLAITKKSTTAGQGYLEISELVAVFWARPADP